MLNGILSINLMKQLKICLEYRLSDYGTAKRQYKTSLMYCTNSINTSERVHKDDE